MKDTFKFKYTPLVWALLILVAVFSVAGIAWNIYNLVYFLYAGALKIITYSLLICVTIALAVLAFSVIFFGRYTISDKELIMHLGLFKNKTNIDDVVQITHFKKSDKLVVYFADAKYSVLLIAPSEYEHFVLSLRAKKPSVIYDSRIDGEDTPA